MRLCRFGLTKRHRLGLEPQRHSGAKRHDCTPVQLYRSSRALTLAVLMAVEEGNAEDLRMALVNLQLINIEFVRRLEPDKTLKVVPDQGVELLSGRMNEKVAEKLRRILDAV